jgi:hypothetical protein
MEVEKGRRSSVNPWGLTVSKIEEKAAEPSP